MSECFFLKKENKDIDLRELILLYNYKCSLYWQFEYSWGEYVVKTTVWLNFHLI